MRSSCPSSRHSLPRRVDRACRRASPSVASERPPGPTVDFVAVEADGTPVADLQPSEVEIRIGDRVRAVRSLRRVTTAPAPAVAAAPARVPPPYGTNDSVAAGRRFVLVVDQESFDAGREPLFRNAVEGLLAAADARRSDDGRGAAVRRRAGAVHLRHGAHPAGDGARDRPGIAQRDRIGAGLPDAPVPRIARRVSAGSAAAPAVAADGRALHGRARRAAARCADGRWRRACASCSSTSSAASATAASAARANFYVLQPADVGIGASAWRADDRRASATADPTTRSKASSTSPASPAARGCRSTRRAPPPCSASRGRARRTTTRSSSPSRGRGLRPQPAASRARLAPRRHRARSSGDHACRSARGQHDRVSP